MKMETTGLSDAVQLSDVFVVHGMPLLESLFEARTTCQALLYVPPSGSQRAGQAMANFLSSKDPDWAVTTAFSDGLVGAKIAHVDEAVFAQWLRCSFPIKKRAISECARKPAGFGPISCWMETSHSSVDNDVIADASSLCAHYARVVCLLREGPWVENLRRVLRSERIRSHLPVSALGDTLLWAVKSNEPRAVETLLSVNGTWNTDQCFEEGLDDPVMISARMPLIVPEHGGTLEDALRRNADVMALLCRVFPARGFYEDDYPIKQAMKLKKYAVVDVLMDHGAEHFM